MTDRRNVYSGGLSRYNSDSHRIERPINRDYHNASSRTDRHYQM